MAPALKISRAALEAAAKAAGCDDLRKITISQFRAFCTAASDGGSGVAPAGTAAPGAGLGAKGPGAVGANGVPGAGLAAANLRAPAVPARLGAEGLVAGFRAGALVAGGHGRGGAAKAYLGLRHRAFCDKASDGGSRVTPAGTGTGPAAPGAGLGAKGTGTGPAAPGAGLGAKGTGIGAAGLAGAAGGLGVKGAAGVGLRVAAPSAGTAGGGQGSGRASTAMIGARAAFSTDGQHWPSCPDCQYLTVQVINKERLILEEVAGLRKEFSSMKAENIKFSFRIVASALGAFVAVAGYFAPLVQKAWQADTIAEVDRQAAARKQEAHGGAKGPTSAAVRTTPAIPNGAADQKKG